MGRGREALDSNGRGKVAVLLDPFTEAFELEVGGFLPLFGDGEILLVGEGGTGDVGEDGI
jgi:hypothetical protein